MSCPNAGKRRKKCDKLRSAAEHPQGIAAATIALKYLNRSLLLLHWFGAFFYRRLTERDLFTLERGLYKRRKEAMAGSLQDRDLCIASGMLPLW